MKKVNKLLLAGLMTLVLTGCGAKNAGPSIVYKTVDFSENYTGGEIVDTMKVKQGFMVSRPEDPSRDGYVFDNWYSESTTETLFDFTQPIVENTMVYANWFEAVTVVFVSDNAIYKTVDVAKDTAVTAAVAPESDTSVFKGWFADPDCKVAFDFSQAITEDIYVYAGWTQKDWSAADKQLMQTYLCGQVVPFIDLSGLLSSSTVMVETLTTGDDCIYIYNLTNEDNDLLSENYGNILTAYGFDVSEPEYSGDMGMGVYEIQETHQQIYVIYYYEAPSDDAFGAPQIIAYVDEPVKAFPTAEIGQYFGVEVPAVDGTLYRAYDNVQYEGYEYFGVLCYDLEASSLNAYATKLANAGWDVVGKTATSFAATIDDEGAVETVQVTYFEEEGLLQVMVNYTMPYPTALIASYFPTVEFPVLAGVYDVDDQMAEEGYLLVDVTGFGGETGLYAYMDTLVDAGFNYLGADGSYYAEYGLIAYMFVSPDGTADYQIYYYPDYQMVRLVFANTTLSPWATIQTQLASIVGLTLPAFGGTNAVYNASADSYGNYYVYGFNCAANSAMNYATMLAQSGYFTVTAQEVEGVYLFKAVAKYTTADQPKIVLEFYQSGGMMVFVAETVHTVASMTALVNNALGVDSFVCYNEPVFVKGYYCDLTSIYWQWLGILIIEVVTDDCKSAAKYAAQLEEAGFTIETNGQGEYGAYSPDYSIVLDFYYVDGELVIMAIATGVTQGTWNDVQTLCTETFGYDEAIPSPGATGLYEISTSYLDQYGCIVASATGVNASDYATILENAGWDVVYYSEDDYYDAVSPEGCWEIQFYPDEDTGALTIDIYGVVPAVEWTTDLLDGIMAEYGVTGVVIPNIPGAMVTVEEGPYAAYIFDYYVIAADNTVSEYAAILEEAGWTLISEPGDEWTSYEKAFGDTTAEIDMYDDEDYGLVINVWTY